MTSEKTSVFDELRFELDLMHLLAGCEASVMTESVGATAAARLASDLTQISSAMQ